MKPMAACLGCGKACAGSRCEGCAKVQQEVSLERPGERVYNRRIWGRVRQRVLERDVYCRLRVKCDAERPAVATEVDHIMPVARGGAAYDEVNLQGVCTACHSHKTASEDGGFGSRGR